MYSVHSTARCLDVQAQTQLPPRMRQKVARLPIRHQHMSRFVCHDRSRNGVSLKRFLDCELRRYAAALSYRQLRTCPRPQVLYSDGRRSDTQKTGTSPSLTICLSP